MSTQGGAGADPDRGRRIGKYEILTRLSMGGMAELFLAFTSGPGGFRKFVAVKQILPDIKKDDQFVKMFLDEARITAAFSHANIGQVFDLGEEDGELYLAMEFLPGQNLEQVVKAASRKGQPLPVGFSSRVLRDSCLGLHYAHHFTDPAGKPVAVVHRDVSPKNVMITYDGVVKVIDFGIAKARGKLGRTQVGTVKGTSGYMSPEQVRNQALDGRSDLFSAGVMLHELLTGQRLFNGPHEAAVMMQIVSDEIPSPRSLNPAVPEALDAVVMRALARDSSKRFATCREMARAIEAALGSELFDEDGMAAVMGELFEEKRQKTRTLLELASRAEDARVSEAAGALQQEEGPEGAGAAKSPPRPRLTPDVPSDANSPTRSLPARRPEAAHTPRTGRTVDTSPGTRTPRPAGTEAAAPARAPRVDSAPEGAPSRTPRPRLVAKSEADEASAQTGVEEALNEPSDLQTQRFRSRPPRPGAAPARAGRAGGARSDTPRETPASGKQGSGWLGKIVWLGVIAGLGVLVSREPVRKLFVPAYESAKKWVKDELDPPAPQDPAADAKWPPARSGPPATFVQHEAPAEPTTPPPAQPEAPAKVEEPVVEEKKDTRSATANKGTRATKDGANSAHRSGATEEAVAAKGKRGRPATSEAPAAPRAPAAEPVTTVTQSPDGMAQVLDTRTAKGAAKAGLGWLTLSTLPLHAAVFDGSTQLGTTPLQKFPLPVGTYRLRVVDPTSSDGASKLLSAPIRPGEVTKLQIRLADLPSYAD
ncbi:serine/threonine protein kinase [Corallococcus sp. H22C18031201]|nr:serine/threonine-protein kinase [Citreicoccus inhibens]MBU8899419.1 serine/threonine protein kinase [Citreicoccus inhibens]RJS17126.1 serine/threonine protein kinase [Corallococcus sp. H22C18031201]